MHSPAIHIKVTVHFEKKFWVADFERSDGKNISVARTTFPQEPTDPEIADYLQHHFAKLHFSKEQAYRLTIKRPNYKRLQREIKRELQSLRANSKRETLSQELLRLELEKNKLSKKQSNKALKDQKLEEKFLKRQVKRKQKHRGH